jgi:hypothetical protein
METDRTGEREWEQGWDGHERAQRRRLAKLPLPAKLQWLEEAQRLVEHLRAARKTRRSGKPGPPRE